MFQRKKKTNCVILLVKLKIFYLPIVVGGGPTGVEFAAELNDFKEDLTKAFPLVKDHFKISIVQSAEHILNSYSEAISVCKNFYD
jgi:NADH dehydrogenase FAD-containing subunit